MFSALPFQEEAIAFALERGGSAMLRQDPGSGKTYQGARVLDAAPPGPALVVCPSNIALQWADRLLEYLPGRVDVQILGEKRKKARRRGEGRRVIICGWGILPREVGRLVQGPWAQIVMDESHYAKEIVRETWHREHGELIGTPKGNRSSAAALLARGAQERRRGVLLLTATPAPNALVDWWGQLSLLNEAEWGRTATRFRKRFCGAIDGEYGLVDQGPTRKAELEQRLREYVHHVPAEVVQGQLPGYTVAVEYVSRADQDRADVGGDYHRLAKAAAKGDKQARGFLREADASLGARRKRSAAVRALTPGLRCLALTTRVEDAQELAEATRRAYPGRLVLLGDSDQKQRKKVIAAYRASRDAILIATGQAWGTGVDGLQVTERMLLVGLPWTIGELEQWAGRVVRLGQLCPVEIILLAAEASPDDRILEALVEKAGGLDGLPSGRLGLALVKAIASPSMAWRRSLWDRAATSWASRGEP